MAELFSAKDVLEVPDLLQDCPVVAAAEVWNSSSLRFERSLELAQRVSRLVRRCDPKPIKWPG